MPPSKGTKAYNLLCKYHFIEKERKVKSMDFEGKAFRFNVAFSTFML